MIGEVVMFLAIAAIIGSSSTGCRTPRSGATDVELPERAHVRRLRTVDRHRCVGAPTTLGAPSASAGDGARHRPALAVGASRIYRGMHHPTDVIASLILGLLWVGALVMITARPAATDVGTEPREVLIPRHEQRRPQPRGSTAAATSLSCRQRQLSSVSRHADAGTSLMAGLLLGPMLRHVTRRRRPCGSRPTGPARPRCSGTERGRSASRGTTTRRDPRSSNPEHDRLRGAPRRRVGWPLPDSACPLHHPNARRRFRRDAAAGRLVPGRRTPRTAVVARSRGRRRKAEASTRCAPTACACWRPRPRSGRDLLVLVGDQVYADDPSPGAGADPDARKADGRRAPDEHRGRLRGVHLAVPRGLDARGRALDVLGRASDDDLRRPRHDRRLEHLRDVGARHPRQPWWREHVIGGLDVVLDLPAPREPQPDEIAAEGMLDALQRGRRAAPCSAEWASESEEFTPVPGGYRFSFSRDLGDGPPGRHRLPQRTGARARDRAMVDETSGRGSPSSAARPVGHLCSPRHCRCSCPAACTTCRVERGGVRRGVGTSVRPWLRRADAPGPRPRGLAGVRRVVPTRSSSCSPSVAEPGRRSLRRPSPCSRATSTSATLAESHLRRAAQRCESHVHQVVSSPIRNALAGANGACCASGCRVSAGGSVDDCSAGVGRDRVGDVGLRRRAVVPQRHGRARLRGRCREAAHRAHLDRTTTVSRFSRSWSTASSDLIRTPSATVHPARRSRAPGARSAAR